MITRRMDTPTWAATTWMGIGALGLAACAGGTVPTRQRTDAVAAVRSARELGASNTPEASLHLALADEQIEQAEALIRSGQMESAERLLLRARADAELAMALRREAESQSRASESHERVEDQRDTTMGPVAREGT